jgi:hypothetical protein
MAPHELAWGKASIATSRVVHIVSIDVFAAIAG